MIGGYDVTIVMHSFLSLTWVIGFISRILSLV